MTPLDDFESRRRTLMGEIDARFKSRREFCQRSGISPSRLSRALDPETASDRRLSPIERALRKLVAPEAPPVSTAAVNSAFEYLLVEAEPTEEAELERLNRLGSEGWEMAGTMGGRLYLKRRIGA